MKKRPKNREDNISNTIKSILLSNRELNPNNLKFNMFREILLCDKLDEIIEKKTSDFRKLVVFYKDKINECPQLQSANFYFEKAEKVRIKKVQNIVNSGQATDIVVNKLVNNNRDKDLEENWINRNYTFMKLTNGIFKVKIEDLTQFEYTLKMLKLETIKNIITDSFSFDKNNLEKWINSIFQYSHSTYNLKPIINENIISISNIEKYFVYYVITDGKIHVIHRKRN